MIKGVSLGDCQGVKLSAMLEGAHADARGSDGKRGFGKVLAIGESL